ncbi:MAG TPA: universal stress protein [Planctomycetaceae bacterium]|nr:universal stress protein [Planctomycetaceae bacterium]
MEIRVVKQPIQRILCPVDFSEASAAALAYAERLTRSTGAELVLVHAFDIPASLTYADVQNPADPAVRQQLEELPVSFTDVKTVRVLHAGPPGEVICWLAQHRACDLIVMGTHGRTGLKHLLLGSVAEYVMRHARCPVVTVRERPADEPPLTEPLLLPPRAPRFM